MAVVPTKPDYQVVRCTAAFMQEESLRTITGLGIAVRLTDTGELQIRAANAAFFDLTRLTENELASTRLIDLLGPSRDELVRIVRQVLSTRRPHDATISLLTINGLKRYQIVALCDQPGWPVDELMLVGADITSSEAIRDLDGVLTTMRDVLWSVQVGSKHMSYASRSAETLLGVTPAELMNEPSCWRRHVHPDDVQRLDAAWQA